VIQETFEELFSKTFETTNDSLNYDIFLFSWIKLHLVKRSDRCIQVSNFAFLTVFTYWFFRRRITVGSRKFPRLEM